MRRIVVALIGLLATVVTVGAPPLAERAHFTFHQVSILDTTVFGPAGTLRLEYREGGVDPN